MVESQVSVLNGAFEASLGAIYRQRSPRETVLHQVIIEHYPKFHEESESLPDHIEAE